MGGATLKAWTIAAAAALAMPWAAAQDAAFLSKDEVTRLATGKKWDHTRLADNQKIRWDLREGGNLFANNYTANGSDSGSWLVNDEGQLCVKWRGRSQNRCVNVRKAADRTQLVDSSGGPYADLTAAE
jgi:hypothetical protein